MFVVLVGLCCLSSALPWYLLGDSIDPDRGGLKLIAHYAQIPLHTDLLSVGSGSKEDFVLPDSSSGPPQLLGVANGHWMLTTGANGGAIAGPSGPVPGAKLAFPGRYTLSTAGHRVDFRLDDEIRILISMNGNAPSISLLDSNQGSTKRIQEINADLLSDTDKVSIVRNGRTYILRKHKRISFDGISLEWMKERSSWWEFWKWGEISQAPLAITMSEDSGSPTQQLIWPGASISLSNESAVITASADQSRTIRISSTNPTSNLTVSPSTGGLGIANGTLADSLGMSGKYYRLAVLQQQNDANAPPTELAVLFRVSEHFNPWNFVSGGSFQSWNDAAVFNPYRLTPVGTCGANTPSTAIWIPSASSAPTSSGASPVGQGSTSNSPQYSLISLIPPAWMNQREMGRPVVLCADGTTFHLTAFAEDGSVIPPPLDGILGARDRTLRQPRRETLISTNTGDTILFAGRAYLLTDTSMPSSLKLFIGLTPFVFVFAALPMAWVLSSRLLVQWSGLPRSASGFDWNRTLRLGPVFAPSIGLAAIVGMMTVGAYFQLRLATSSQLVGHPKYFNIFLTSCVEALAVATFLVKWLESTRSAAGLCRATALALLSLALGSVILLWAEPTLYNIIATPSQFLETSVPQSTRMNWLIPIMFLSLAAIAVFLSTLNATWLTKLMKSLNQSQTRLAKLYNSAYQKLPDRPEYVPGTEVSRLGNLRYFVRRGIRDSFKYLICLFLFYISWAASPLGWFAMSKFPNQFDLEWKSWSRIARNILVLLLCAFPIAIVAVAARLIPQIANVSKEALPPLIVLWAALALGSLSFFAQSEQGNDPGDKSRLLSLAIGLLCAFAFALEMLFLPEFFNWIYDPKVMAINWCVIIVLCFVIWIRPEWKVSGTLLFHVLPFLAILFLVSVIFKDFGAVLVWTWTLSWIGAWALMLNVLLAGPRRVSYSYFGTLLCSLLLLVLPLTILGTFNRLFGASNATFVSRPLGRFRLVAAPFYYSAGEWLANVQLMAVGEKNVHWIPNLNSDVALNGLHYLLPNEQHLYAILFFIVIALLAAAFGENFRYAVRATSIDKKAESIRAALISGIAMFGLGMLLFVHLGASLFDILPLTGVPCPWLSHSLVTHIVMTSLIMTALVFGSDCALKERGRGDA